MFQSYIERTQGIEGHQTTIRVFMKFYFRVSAVAICKQQEKASHFKNKEIRLSIQQRTVCLLIQQFREKERISIFLLDMTYNHYEKIITHFKLTSFLFSGIHPFLSINYCLKFTLITK